MNLYNLTLGQIVSENYHAATIFEKHSLDFCCMGNRNFVDACTQGGVKPESVAAEISQLTPTANPVTDFTEWPLDLLADYIFRKHHHYIEEVTPTIKNLLNKICAVHGDAHPELLEIQKIFNKTSGELAAHMKKEELIVFPFIKKLALAKEKRIAITSKLFDSIVSPIKQMNDDHLDEGEQLQRMAALSNNYTPPLDACHSYSTAYQMLHEYEKDMHRHIHLENNLLFPRAIQLETEMLKSAITGNINEN